MLIKCSECGKEVSDKASSCIHCGCPIEKKIKLSNEICIFCNKNSHVEKDGKDTCSVCGYVFNYDEYKSEHPEWSYGNSVNSNQPKCPTCSSTNLSKISTMSKAGSVFMFGLLSQKVKKTWHCNNCKYEW